MNNNQITIKKNTESEAFTLVELLAVIVIIAFILLITIPIVLNVIEKTKIKTYQRSIDLYGGAINKAIAEYISNNENADIQVIEYNDIKEYIKYEGNKVECNIVIYSDNTIYLSECKVNGEDVDYTFGTKNNKENPQSTTASSTSNQIDNSAICKAAKGVKSTNLGTLYLCQVSKDRKYNFYVLSNNNDDTVNLIMNNNICEDGTLPTTTKTCNFLWHQSDINNYGPDNVLKELYEITKNWTNVPSMVLDYTDENNSSSTVNGYRKIVTDLTTGITTIYGKNGAEDTNIGTKDLPLRARLPKLQEVMDAQCRLNTAASCPTWLVENLSNDSSQKYSSINRIEKIYTYWLLSSGSDNRQYSALAINYEGKIQNQSPGFRWGCNGIRPVITVPTSYLSK